MVLNRKYSTETPITVNFNKSIENSQYDVYVVDASSSPYTFNIYNDFNVNTAGGSGYANI